MGRQWLHAKRAIVNLKKGQVVGKLVKEITVAAKLGGGDPAGNARLFAALEKARKASVTREAIERAIAKGTGSSGDKTSLDHVIYEGYAPHKVPVIVEVYTDNHNRTASEIRVLFKHGVLGGAGSNKFLFDYVGLVEAHTMESSPDLEAVAIEAGADDFSTLANTENDDIPVEATGARFVTGRTEVHAVSQWLKEHNWQVVTAELAYVAKSNPELDETTQGEVGEFLHNLSEHDDVQRVWAAVK